jgi:hypothetical protein
MLEVKNSSSPAQRGQELMKRLFLVALFLAVPAVAQTSTAASERSTYAVAEVAYPDAPTAVWTRPAFPVLAVAVKTKPATQVEKHVFLDRPARIRFAVLAGVMAADGITTQQVLSKGGRELNPVARPFVTRGATGQFAASSLGYAATVTASYLLHRTNHHKLEHFFQHAVIGIEGECVVDNLIQGARIERSPNDRVQR